MRRSLDASSPPPQASFFSVSPSGIDGDGGTGLLAALTGTLKRARIKRPGRHITGRGSHSGSGRNAAAVDPASAEADVSGASGRGGDGVGGDGAGGGGFPDLWAREPEVRRGRSRAMSLVPRLHPVSADGSAAPPRGLTGHSHDHDHSRGRKHGWSIHHAVPVATTRVQDGIKWLNLVRLVNLARLFRTCLLPRNRRRVRFNTPPGQRGLMLPSGGGEAGKTSGDLGGGGTGGATGSPTAASRPVYIQVRQGRQLVWPSFEGMDYSCFCLLTVGNQACGSTQAVQLAQAGPGAGGGGNTVQWNEVFSLPRAMFEGVSDGRVVLEVWSSESVGDDVLVGQAELLLGPMLQAETPHPLSTVLELQTLDEETGQVEPGTCGELHVAAWVEPERGDRTGQRPCALTSAAPADLHEAGVVTSNLSAPCGSKSVPQVVHSPLGTLYEEPCVVALKIAVVGLVDLSYDALTSGATSGGISRRRVRLEGGGHRCISMTRDTRDSSREREKEKERRSLNTAFSGRPSLMGASSSAVPFASPSITHGMNRYLNVVKRKGQQQRLLAQLQSPRTAAPERGSAAAAATASRGAAALCCLPCLPFASAGPLDRRHLGGRGAAGGGASVDELMEVEDDAAPAGGAGPGGGGGGGGADDKTMTGDDDGEGSSLTLNPTLPLSGMTADEQSAAAQGQGVFCYFKVSVDKQSHKSRLRWLPAPLQPSTGLTPQQLQHMLDSSASVTLQPSIFVFTLARPLSNVTVGLAMYVTTSARRRGRVVGRLTVQLYDLLDRVLGTTFGSGVPTWQRTDMGVTGKKVEVVQQFDEQELGSVRLAVQVADLDERASLFRLPLVSDPQQLLAESPVADAAGRSIFRAAMLHRGDPAVAAAAAAATAGAGGGGAPARKSSLGPVLSDTDLLLRVLRRAGVEPDVEDMFVASYSRLGSIKAAGAGVKSLRLSGFGGGGGGGGGSKQVHAGSSSTWDPVRVIKDAVAAAGAGGLSQPDDAVAAAAAAASGFFSRLFRSPDAVAFPDVLPALERSPGGSFAGKPDGALAGGGSGGGAGRTSTGAAGAGARGVLGSLVLRVASISAGGALQGGGGSCCCIVKCGPHWLRTEQWGAAQEGGGMPQWQVIVPLYHPATILTAGVFASSAKSVMGLTFSDNLVLLSRVRLKLSSVRPFRRNWHIVAMYMTGSSPPGSSTGAPLVAVLGLKVQYCSLRALAMSYLQPTAPESLYELDLDADVALRMEADARKISEHWLSSAQPPIPPEVARLLLDDGRMAFNFTRTKNNWRRVKSGMRLLLGLSRWYDNICSWRSAQDSWEVVGCIALMSYLPSTACKLFFYMAALRGVKALLQFRRRVAARAEGGTEAAAALLISPRAAAGAAAAGADAAGGNVSAAAAAAAVAAVAAASGGNSPREGVGTVGDVTIGGGVVDGGNSDDDAGEDSKVPLGTVAEFKRKFAELVELGLLLQNLFDDVASILERLQAVLSFQDVVASCLFILACCLLGLLVALVGLPTTMFVALLWQVRPPSLRDALPPPPLSYFMKLPCKSAAEFG